MPKSKNIIFSHTAINDLTFRKLFRLNQNVETMVDQDLDMLTVISKQETSTPGVVYLLDLLLEPNSNYEYIVEGISDPETRAYLWAQNADTHDLVIDQNKVFLPTTQFRARRTIISTGGQRMRINVGVLMLNPEEGHNFTIKALALIKRQGWVRGSWRQYETGNQLTLDKFNVETGQWISVESHLVRSRDDA